MKEKKVALYLRVSTSHQNISLQKNDLVAFCERMNFSIYKIYTDIASGAKEKRTSLNLLMADSKKKKFETLLIWKLDRLARNTRHLIFTLEELQNRNIDLISYTENIDFSSIMGKAMFTMISAIAELERELIRERVIAGIENAKLKGVKLGRPKRRNDTLIRRLRSQGLSFRAIAKKLNTSLGSVQQALK